MRLLSNKSLIGYLTINLDHEWGAGLKQSLINRIVSDCYPNTTMYIDRDKGNWGEELENIIANIERTGKFYIDIGKKDINIYYNFHQLKEIMRYKGNNTKIQK